MDDLLNHPAVQAGLAPFMVALVVAILFQKLRLSGLSIVAGFAITVYLVSGFALDPLTSSRKLVWLAIASGLVAIPLNMATGRLWRAILTMLAVAATLWMSVRILEQHPVAEALQWGIGSALFVGWLVFWMDDLKNSTVRSASAGMALGFGTGVASLVGASALLGQYGLSLGAAAGACLLIMFITNRQLTNGRSFTLPVAFTSGLIGCLAVLTAQLPGYVLPVLATIPLAAKLPVPENLSIRLQAVYLCLATFVCAALAMYLSWRVNGAPPL